MPNIRSARGPFHVRLRRRATAPPTAEARAEERAASGRSSSRRRAGSHSTVLMAPPREAVGTPEIWLRLATLRANHRRQANTEEAGRCLNLPHPRRPPPAELLDLREVMRRTRLSRSTIYALKAAGLFPPSPSTSAPRRALVRRRDRRVDRNTPPCRNAAAQAVTDHDLDHQGIVPARPERNRRLRVAVGVGADEPLGVRMTR